MIEIRKASERLAMHEGVRLRPYFCTKGKQTIGVGRNLDDNPITPEEEKVIGDWRHGITKEAAFFLLRHDINRVVAECEKYIPFWKKLDDERQYALMDMAFNMGIKRLLGFKKMMAFLGVGNYRQAAVECLASQYAKEVGRRAQRIAKTIETGRFEI